MKHIVITGGSDGIGEALAKNLCKDHKVTLLARNKDKLEQLAAELGCDFAVCDVRSHEAVQAAFEEIKSRHGSIDILINNAGVIVNGDITETPYETIETVMSTNATGAIFVTKACLEIMKPQKEGLIIQIVSTAGLTARSNRSIYNASKWAMTGFTRAIQEEAGAYGVRVTGFFPGTVKTHLFKKAGLGISGLALETSEVVKTLRFVIEAGDDVIIPEIGIRPFNAI